MRKKTLSVLFFAIVLQAASAFFPPKGYEAYINRVTAPDGSFSVYQCFKKAGESYKNQTWIFPSNGQKGSLLLSTRDVAGFEQGIEISPNSQWLLCERHICAGTYTVSLYKRVEGLRFSPVFKLPIGDAAWNFFAQQSGVTEDQIPTFHKCVSFVKWTDRYLILSLSGLHITKTTRDRFDRWIVDDWVCAFDLEKKKFVLLPDMICKNKGRVFFKRGDPRIGS